MKTKKSPKARNGVAIACFARFGRTTKVYHDRRQARDRNRSQALSRALDEG